MLAELALLAGALRPPGGGGDPLAAPDSLAAICARYADYDFDGDGRAEIAHLRLAQEPTGRAPLVLILVEERLLAPLAEAPPSIPPLERLADDLRREGWSAARIAVALPPSQEHRDGTKLLALREFLRAVAADHELAGVLLVGRFPDAFLVRTCNWRKPEEALLRRVPEVVADRADIVLADLDGHWEDLYLGPRVLLPALRAHFPDGIPAHRGLCEELERSTLPFEDCFHVSDGRLEVAPLDPPPASGPAWMLRLDDQDADRECSTADRARPNPVAQPEIRVSRIDPSGVAWSPDPELEDADGRRLIGPTGKVQALRFATADQVPSWNRRIWAPDPLLERRLLADFLDRDHAYRSGVPAAAFRPASIACGLGSGYEGLKGAAPAWKSLHEPAADVHGQPDLCRFLDWLRVPAVLRTLRAHSDPWGSVFARTDPAALDARFAAAPRGGPMSWTPRGKRLVPSLAQAAGGGKLDFFLLRGLWGNGLAPDPSAIYLHTGCNAISPPGAAHLPFDAPDYDRFNGGAALLFYAGGVALVGRAKVFYDEPRGFAQTLAGGGTVGDAWAHSFQVEAESSWARAGGDIGRKRSYFWSILGDWTLRLPTPGRGSAAKAAAPSVDHPADPVVAGGGAG